MPLGKRFYSWRAQMRDSELSSTTKLVLHTLSTHMNDEGEGPTCFPSHSTLAREASLSVSAVKEHLDIAEKEGWIEKESRKSESGGLTSNRYYLSSPRPPGNLPPPPPEDLPLGRQVASNSISLTAENPDSAPSGRGAAFGGGESSEEKSKLHPEMNLLPRMEKILFESPARKTLRWKKPRDKALECLQSAERMIGADGICQAWDTWIQGDTPGTVESFCFAVANNYRGRPKRQHVDFKRESVSDSQIMASYEQQAADEVRRILGQS